MSTVTVGVWTVDLLEAVPGAALIVSFSRNNNGLQQMLGRYRLEDVLESIDDGKGLMLRIHNPVVVMPAEDLKKAMEVLVPKKGR
jgi:hypothetical protein